MKNQIVYFVNYRKRPSTRKPKRLWAKRTARFNTEQEAKDWMKENGLKPDRWTNIEKSEIDNTLLADIFHL